MASNPISRLTIGRLKYQKIGFAVKYVNLKFRAHIELNGLLTKHEDILNVDEVISILSQKGILDTYSLDNIWDIAFEKALTSTVNTSDKFNRSFQKVLLETVNPGDSSYRYVKKTFEDSLELTDGISFEGLKTIRDSFGLGNLVNIVPTKGIVTGITLGEVLPKFVFSKELKDSLTMGSSISNELHKNIFDTVEMFESFNANVSQWNSLDDLAFVQEEFNKEFGKDLKDIFTLNHLLEFGLDKFLETSFDLGDQVLVEPCKVFYSSTEISDAVILETVKGVLDTISLTDSGKIEINPYAIDYFLEDYVGLPTNF